MIELYVKYIYTFRRLITAKRISSDSDTDNEERPSKKTNLLQPPSPPPRINSTIYTSPVQYNSSSSTSIQSLQMTPRLPPCTSISPAALSVTQVSSAMCSTPTSSSTSQRTSLAAHDTTLVTVAEIVPNNGQDSQG